MIFAQRTPGRGKSSGATSPHSAGRRKTVDQKKMVGMGIGARRAAEAAAKEAAANKDIAKALFEKLAHDYLMYEDVEMKVLELDSEECLQRYGV